MSARLTYSSLTNLVCSLLQLFCHVVRVAAVGVIDKVGVVVEIVVSCCRICCELL